MKVVFLGTSSMVPTRDRNHTSIYLEHNGEGILIDCGEGTQRQLRKHKIPVTRITKVFITHWHGDHVLGLPGLIQSMSAHHYHGELEIFGIKGTKRNLEMMLKSIEVRNLIKMKIVEKETGTVCETEDFLVKTMKVKHCVKCLAYKFTEKDRRKINLEYTKKFGLVQDPILGKLQKGKDITYEGKKITVEKGTILKKGKVISVILDTKYFKKLSEFAKDSDLLISEATLMEKDRNPDHMTGVDAGKIAKDANVKELVLTHFSQRYRNLDEIRKEAKKEFKNVKISEDFMEIEL
jgi:ribonuclease Z